MSYPHVASAEKPFQISFSTLLVALLAWASVLYIYTSRSNSPHLLLYSAILFVWGTSRSLSRKPDEQQFSLLAGLWILALWAFIDSVVRTFAVLSTDPPSGDEFRYYGGGHIYNCCIHSLFAALFTTVICGSAIHRKLSIGQLSFSQFILILCSITIFFDLCVTMISMELMMY